MESPENSPDLISIVLDSSFNLSVSLNAYFLALALIFVLIGIFAYGKYINGWQLKSFDIDEAEFGIGNQKVKLKPNLLDRQIAYQVWIELSTRKIGLEIDLNDDVVYEIYDSWYNFFSITRELLKEVPVNKFKRHDTERIIKLTIDILNDGLRPHLTKWQSRFRKWYENALKNDDNLAANPQEIQKMFPEFEELEKDLIRVNQHLINYRQKMYEIISGLETTN
jgi:hypothetical protein